MVLARGTGWTVRLRLTVLYGALFLVSGGVLLAITYELVAHRLPPDAFFVSRSVNRPGSAIRILITGHALSPSGASAPPGSLPNGLPPIQLPVPPDAIIGQVRSVVGTAQSSSLHQLLVESGVALAIMFLASGGLGWLMAGRALRPLRAMTSAARQISEDNLHDRLPENGPRDELRELATTFNGLLSRLEGAFDSERQFVANASHELRTPLTLERALIEVALADPDADSASLRAVCQRVLAIGAAQEALIEALITLARSQRGLETRVPVDLSQAVARAVEASARDAAARSVAVEVDLAPAVVPGDRVLLERLAANLVDNAVRHNYRGGNVSVQTVPDNGRQLLRVTNTGPVLAAGEAERILQPFQRLGQDRVGRPEGLGLGLSIVQAIATAHGARLTVVAPDTGGLEVEVSFPRTAEDPAQR